MVAFSIFGKDPQSVQYMMLWKYEKILNIQGVNREYFAYMESVSGVPDAMLPNMKIVGFWESFNMVVCQVH